MKLHTIFASIMVARESAEEASESFFFFEARVKES
jgi:hypothetical protein